ncbi:hypothetical protein H0H87_006851 [Tephrocybe sp. NHM501043]|nr:hypothetical protein H0H87_006851 [Tephrocybe sp. NHM501043]
MEGNQKATILYNAAFGPADINSDPKKVDKTINALENGNLRGSVTTTKFENPNMIAKIHWVGEKKKNGPTWISRPVEFGDRFHASKGVEESLKLNNAGRAGTLIHEAAHQLAYAGDDVNKSGKIVKVNDGRSKKDGRDGYSSNANMHKTVAEIDADTQYRDIRKEIKNMHDNAESYALFASLCSQPGALRRRDVRLWNRALRVGNHVQLIHLARRNSCKVPPTKNAQHTDKGAARAAPKKPVARAGPHPGLKPTSFEGKSPAPKAVMENSAITNANVNKPGHNPANSFATIAATKKVAQVGSKAITLSTVRPGAQPTPRKGKASASNLRGKVATGANANPVPKPTAIPATKPAANRPAQVTSKKTPVATNGNAKASLVPHASPSPGAKQLSSPPTTKGVAQVGSKKASSATRTGKPTSQRKGEVPASNMKGKVSTGANANPGPKLASPASKPAAKRPVQVTPKKTSPMATNGNAKAPLVPHASPSPHAKQSQLSSPPATKGRAPQAASKKPLAKPGAQPAAKHH